MRPFYTTPPAEKPAATLPQQKLITGSAVLPDYLSWFLNSPAGQRQVKRGITGSAIPGIRADAIERIIVPVPPLSVQEKLVREIEHARTSRRGKLERAQGLLSGLNTILLERLGIPPSGTHHARFFAARLADAWGRCDADFHSPKFKELREAIERCPHPVLSVGKICSSIRTGFAAGREVQAFDSIQGIPHIRPLNISRDGELKFDGTKYVPEGSVPESEIIQEGEVLLNNTNSTEWVGKATVFKGNRRCCCSNHITRLVVDRDIVVASYVASLFNAIRSTGYFGLIATNFVNQAGINTETLSRLRLPIPERAFQRCIIDELERRGLEAQRLREEAAREWGAAKARFDLQLLNGEPEA